MRILTRLTGDPDSFAESWPPAPRVHHGDAEWARSLLSRDDIDAIIARPGFRPERMRMLMNNGFLDAGLFTEGEAVNPHAVQDRLASGASLLLAGLHGLWDPLTALCEQLTRELGHPVRANSYLTPPGSQGFSHHWDDHSSFLVQTLGSKTWELYPPLAELPARPHSFTPEELAELRADGSIQDPPYLTVDLRAGDVLWLPHGWIHNGYTTTDWSLHVTLGIGAVTRAALIASVLRLLADDPRSRAPLPPNPASDADAVRAEALRTRRLLIEMARDLDDAALTTAVAPLLNVPEPA
jgi:hypothetical protein